MSRRKRRGARDAAAAPVDLDAHRTALDAEMRDAAAEVFQSTLRLEALGVERAELIALVVDPRSVFAKQLPANMRDASPRTSRGYHVLVTPRIEYVMGMLRILAPDIVALVEKPLAELSSVWCLAVDDVMVRSWAMTPEAMVSAPGGSA